MNQNQGGTVDEIFQGMGNLNESYTRPTRRKMSEELVGDTYWRRS
jgi:hypothetical protein